MQALDQSEYLINKDLYETEIRELRVYLHNKSQELKEVKQRFHTQNLFFNRERKEQNEKYDELLKAALIHKTRAIDSNQQLTKLMERYTNVVNCLKSYHERSKILNSSTLTTT